MNRTATSARQLRCSLLTAFFLLALTAPVTAAPFAFSQIGDDLVRVDLMDSSYVPIGPHGLGDAFVFSMDLGPDARVYGAVDGGAGLDMLASFDPATGAGTLLGDLGSDQVAGVAVADGALWAAAGQDVYTVDVPGLASPSIVHTLPEPIVSVAGDASTLYAFGASAGGIRNLYLVDAASGAATPVALNGLSGFMRDAGVAADGALWVRTLESGILLGLVTLSVYRFADPASGAFQEFSQFPGFVGDPEIGAAALAFGPETVVDVPSLGSVGLLALVVLLASLAVRKVGREAA